ncbi:TBP-related factor-like [Teleopsis dalmanni]|uniref:TBP-related factor-like n=1 Tax=Teleopsis dalmanni TaxID=139649 RepID=UPI0018CD7005|nr:TBP-related factor-like [Teleopsis dalmanni]XP_037960143.1 TBP-related factor-like [Teleopsis dalmanni]
MEHDTYNTKENLPPQASLTGAKKIEGLLKEANTAGMDTCDMDDLADVPSVSTNPKAKKLPLELEEAKLAYKVVHAVATFSVGCSLNLQMVRNAIPNAKIDLTDYMGVIVKMTEPKCSTMIYRTGTIAITGARNEIHASHAAHVLLSQLQAIGYNVGFHNYKVSEISAALDLKFPIALQELYVKYVHICTYKPDIYKPLIFNLPEPDITIFIAPDGNVIFTQAKNREDIVKAIDVMYPILVTFKK